MKLTKPPDGRARDEVDEISKEAFTKLLADMQGDYSPEVLKIVAGTKAAVASAWDADSHGGATAGVIPQAKCVLIEFDKDATAYCDDDNTLVTDGETHLVIYNEGKLVKPGDFAEPWIERESEFGLVAVCM